MTIEEILKLGAMGYTKDDIEAMINERLQILETKMNN